MQIINNSYVNRNGAYYNSGGIINGTQRILTNHQTKYWQYGNINNSMGLDNELKNIIKIKEAVYIGRIPTHFGHFIMEGMARLCDVVNIDKPIIGYITDGYLPEGIKPTPRNEIQWIIKSATVEKFYEISEDETYLVETLYVPKLPFHLSHSCSEPWRMSKIINKIVKKAREENNFDIEKYWLCRYGENNDNSSFIYSNPTEPISTQIAKISFANELYGNVGSNTHLSIFAKSNAKTFWTPRDDYNEGDRNQLICDLIKTYNTF